ncbi:chaperone protein ClpD1, chloroplastic isoform X1 [Oryza sativa Japonica Group]|uniref:chaperone protein ClpD1, chloroplastic isoform X1 n=1 Tax=Oryza sativa subsp. japonica TaxID=39947 RepID=UPI000E1BB934|nr:chaperone protein ClpD1, chloroplastic isoform X1 [Oryza sativa Japonica Group]
MEVCCCSTSSAVPGRRFAAAGAAAAAVAARWGAVGVGRAVVLAHPLRPAPRGGHAHAQQAGARRARRAVVRAVFERFTERAVKAVVLSQREAKGLGEGAVAPRHLLLGLIAEDRSAGGFLSSGINIERAREECRGIGARDLTPGAPSPSGSGLEMDIPFSGSCKRVFEVAVEFSRNMGCSFISPEHLALALFTLDDPTTNSLLRSLGADPSQLASVALTRLQAELAKDCREPAGASSFKVPKKSPAGAGRSAFSKSLNSKKEKGALDQFCLDLTTQASGGFIDPIIGREEEIERVVQIICRRTKNNPILLGEAGVGKTAIAEGLALRIANGDVPIYLVAKRIMSLDVGLLIAGAKERGELESRVTSLIREVREAGDVILFIDEVHNLIGSGTVGKGKGAGLDIGNLLKPPLARGELQCIAATTLDEHRMHFEKDKALARRFQPVLVEEPSQNTLQDDAVKILLGLREKYETYHKCKFTLEAINAAVYLSARYIPDRQLPDKAIDLIDEAGSRARMESFNRKKEGQSSILLKSPDEYWQEIRAAQNMHEVVSSNQMKYSPRQENGSAAIKAPSEDMNELTSELQVEEPIVVGTEEIARVASLWSGIPVQQLTADDRKLLVGLDGELRKRVIGQDDAVMAISRAVKRSRVGLNDPDRPIATLLFCGPTGVGKTELTKALAASYFGSESAMLRLDMSEYMERHTVSKLIGSPPGYIGYGETGTLTEAVRRKPFTVVLLDEIEKAHPDIFNILLQIFEDGHLSDSQGRRVSFKNTLIVMTSNIGSTSISKGRRSMGFMTEDTESSSYVAMKSLVMEELKAFFRPELLNRIDEMVVFRPLEKTQMLAILDIILQEVKGRLLALGIGLEVSDAMKDLICEEGYDKSYGARPLRRAVTHLIEDVISEAILFGEYKPGDTILMDIDAGGKLCMSHLNEKVVQLSDPTRTF